MADTSEEAAGRVGWLRAAVLGADDGIVSTAALIVGVAAADVSPQTLLTAGLAGLVAGAASMAAGEYVSVSSQRDLENALLRKEERFVKSYPDVALTELAIALQLRGLEPATARDVAEQLASREPVLANLQLKYGMSNQSTARPLQAALTSAASFAAGAIVPLAGVILGPSTLRIEVAIGLSLIALGLTGALAATAGGASRGRGALRVIAGGGLAMIVSALIGRVVGAVI